MAHAMAVKFGHPGNLVRDYRHWWLLLRPAQVTLGSLVLVAKSEATAFGALDPAAYAELATITAEVEQLLKAKVDFDRINYLMLMMVDPHVHFHILPRYQGERRAGPLAIVDEAWPGPSNLSAARKLSEDETTDLLRFLSQTGINQPR